MKFKDVPVGGVFHFANETISGPWIKLSSRTYYRPHDLRFQMTVAKIYNLKDAKFHACRIGTINVYVEPCTMSDELRKEHEELSKFLKGKLLQ